MSAEILSPELIARTHEAREICETARKGLQSQEAEIVARHQRLSEAEEEIKRLLGFEQEDLVARILEGEDSRPLRPRRRTRIENLKQEIEGLKLAIPILRGRAAQGRSALEAAEEAYANSMLPVVCSTRDTALEEVRAGLAKLAPMFVTMMAQDIVQRRMVGDQFVFTDPGFRMFSGHHVAKTFIENLGDRLRPPELALAALEALADEAALDFIKSIKGE